MPRISQTAKRARAASIVAGIAKRLPRDESVRLQGKDHSLAELAAIFQAQIDALDAVRAARNALSVAVARERAVARHVTAAIQPLRAALQVRFGLDPVAFGDFGLVLPKKRGPKTVAGKLAGAVKARATRKARGTMGRRQRAKVRVR